MGLNVDLDNISNVQYLGALTIGGYESKKLVFDTGSDWLTITSDICDDTCSSKAVYKTANGSTQNVPLPMIYGSANLTGIIYKDKVCNSD